MAHEKELVVLINSFPVPRLETMHPPPHWSEQGTLAEPLSRYSWCSSRAAAWRAVSGGSMAPPGVNQNAADERGGPLRREGSLSSRPSRTRAACRLRSCTASILARAIT